MRDLVGAVVPDEHLCDDGVEDRRAQQGGNALHVWETRPVQDDDGGVGTSSPSAHVRGESDTTICLCTGGLKTASTTQRLGTGVHTSEAGVVLADMTNNS